MSLEGNGLADGTLRSYKLISLELLGPVFVWVPKTRKRTRMSVKTKHSDADAFVILWVGFGGGGRVGCHDNRRWCG